MPWRASVMHSPSEQSKQGVSILLARTHTAGDSCAHFGFFSTNEKTMTVPPTMSSLTRMVSFFVSASKNARAVVAALSPVAVNLSASAPPRVRVLETVSGPSRPPRFESVMSAFCESCRFVMSVTVSVLSISGYGVLWPMSFWINMGAKTVRGAASPALNLHGRYAGHPLAGLRTVCSSLSNRPSSELIGIPAAEARMLGEF